MVLSHKSYNIFISIKGVSTGVYLCDFKITQKVMNGFQHILGHADKGPRNRFTFGDVLDSIGALISMYMDSFATIFKTDSQNIWVKGTVVI